MTIAVALADVALQTDRLKSCTLYDNILATVDAVQAITDDLGIVEACVRDMMRGKYAGLEVVEPFTIDGEGEWGVVVRHFDGIEVAVTNKT